MMGKRCECWIMFTSPSRCYPLTVKRNGILLKNLMWEIEVGCDKDWCEP
jgi:hypothetical protein